MAPRTAPDIRVVFLDQMPDGVDLLHVTHAQVMNDATEYTAP